MFDRLIPRWINCCVPPSLKSRIRSIPVVYRLRNALARRRYSAASHDEVYDDAYFAGVERSTSIGAELMADCIVKRFAPSSVLDVGCGTGALLEKLRGRGVETLGMDYSEHALEYCRRRGVPCIKVNLADLPEESPVSKRYDITINMEVAHQLPEHAAVRLVKFLTETASVVIFSAETPGTFDRLPLNEQEPQYWIETFSRFGYFVDQETTSAWREIWSANQVASFFCKNTLVFTGGR